MKKCISCGEEIHPKRLEILPNAVKCVLCSNTQQKAGITITKGEGDHTYNDIVILDHEEYVRYQEVEHKKYPKREDNISHPDEEEVEPTINDNDEPTELE
jgi:hypothetical protein